MKIYNEKRKDTAKVAVIRAFTKGLGDLTKYGSICREHDIDVAEVIYIDLFDKPIKGSLSIADLRVAMIELEELLKTLSIRVIVDDVYYHDPKKKYQPSNIFSKMFHKDVSLWGSNGVLKVKLNDLTIKMVAGFRGKTIKREMEEFKVIDSEFLLDLELVEIERVNTDERAKEVFRDLYTNSTEIFYDTETSSLRWEEIGQTVLTLQLTGSQNKNKSYVFFYEHEKFPMSNSFRSVISKGLKWLLESGKKIFIHNASFDLLWTKGHIVKDLDFYKVNIYDTMIIYHFLTNSTEEVALGLKESSFINAISPDWETDLEIAKNEICKELGIKKKEFSYKYFDIDMLERYAGIDTIVLAHYWDMLQNLNKKHPARIEVDIIKDTWESSWQGIMQSLYYTFYWGLPFDVNVAKAQLSEQSTEVERLTQKILEDKYTEMAVKKLEKINFDKAMEKYKAKVEAAAEKGKEFKGAKPDIEKGKYDNIELKVEFNPGSLVHKRVLFFEVLGLKVISKTDSGLPACGEAEISEWVEDRPEIEILQYFNTIAKVNKEIGTYLQPFIQLSETSYDGNIRGACHPLNKSLRLRSTSPNVLNLPKTDFKKCFRKKDNFVFQLDYSALENVLSLNHTEDEARLAQYRAGIEDAHSVNAIIAGKALKKPEYSRLDVTSVDDVKYVKQTYPEDRQNAKAVTFALQYLGSFRSIQFGLKIPEDDAISIYNNYWDTYKGERQFFKDCVHEMATKGYITFFGNGVILTPGIEDTPENDETLKAVRTPFNTTSQSGAWLTLKAMDKAMRQFLEEATEQDLVQEFHDGDYCHVFLSVYDSIIYACKPEDAIHMRKTFIEYMTEPYKENQAVLLKADAEIGVSYKAERDFEGTPEELEAILSEYKAKI